MQQYYDMKAEYQDAVLFFRMGDFYEMFDDDAHIAHKVLGIAITTRNKNAEKPTPLAGIPYHAKEKYLPQFIAAGYKVAIAEQVSDPKLKGIVKREVVRVVTPATLSLEGEGYDTSLDSNYIIYITESAGSYGISLLDIKTNDWKVGELANFEALKTEMYKFAPKEVVLSKHLFSHEQISDILAKKYALNIYYFDIPRKPRETLLAHF
ncbi:MAG: hypothetical protein H6767_01725 [Candidatus Peribacteria bacterium]|nr:MAG: hypothetical protein H6767_01725 [Candidatus Peribacteria bacterium]